VAAFGAAALLVQIQAFYLVFLSAQKICDFSFNYVCKMPEYIV
jgi:hypothetical protein